MSVYTGGGSASIFGSLGPGNTCACRITLFLCSAGNRALGFDPRTS